MLVRLQRKVKSRRRTCLVAVVLVLLACGLGCTSVSQRLYEQRLDTARAKRQAVEQTIDYLRANPAPEATSSVHAFVANETINTVLSFADDTTAVYRDEYLLRLSRIRLSSSGGFPLVSVTASASRWGLTAQLSVSATALMTIDEDNPTTGRVSLHVTDVVPEIRWFDFHLIVAGFARDLVQSELQAQLEAALPPFEVPLLIRDEVRMEARRENVVIEPDEDFWEGRIDGRISYPPIAVGADVELARVLFLEDGIHCFLTFKDRTTL